MVNLRYNNTILNRYSEIHLDTLQEITLVVAWLASCWIYRSALHMFPAGGWALPLWKMMELKSVGMMTFPIWWESHNPFMFQTTNQPFIFHYQRVNHHEITIKSPNHQPGFSLNASCQLHEMSAGTIHLGVTQDPPRQPLYSGCRWCRWITYTLAKTTADKTTIEKHKPGSGNPFSTSSVVLRSLIFEHCKPASTSSFSQLELIIVIPIINH